jgi:replicative superfamily II helicase
MVDACLGSIVDRAGRPLLHFFGLPIDEKHLGVVCVYVYVRHSPFPIYDRHTNEETTKQILVMVRDYIT